MKNEEDCSVFIDYNLFIFVCNILCSCLTSSERAAAAINKKAMWSTSRSTSMTTCHNIRIGVSKIMSKRKSWRLTIHSITRSFLSQSKNTWSTSPTKTIRCSASQSSSISVRQSLNLWTISVATSIQAWYVPTYPENQVARRNGSGKIGGSSIGTAWKDAYKRAAEASRETTRVYQFEVFCLVLCGAIGIHQGQHHHQRQLSNLQS